MKSREYTKTNNTSANRTDSRIGSFENDLKRSVDTIRTNNSASSNSYVDANEAIQQREYWANKKVFLLASLLANSKGIFITVLLLSLLSVIKLATFWSVT